MSKLVIELQGKEDLIPDEGDAALVLWGDTTT
jgi:hypothetical protein